MSSLDDSTVVDDGELIRPKKPTDVTWLADPVNHPSAFAEKHTGPLVGVSDRVRAAIAAASLGQTILTVGKVASWDDLEDGQVPENVRLTTGKDGEGSNQLADLSAGSWVLGVLRASVRATKEVEGAKGIKLTLCTSCARWVVSSTAPSSKKCSFTQHCEGTPYTVPAAERLANPPWHLQG